MAEGPVRPDWQAALALGVRLGVITPEAAARARERLAARGNVVAAVAEVAEWAGIEAEAIQHLLGVLDLGTRTGAIVALAEALLSTQ